MPEYLIAALVSGAAAGLTTFGALRVQMAWLRADIDRAHRRIDQLEKEIPCFPAPRLHR